MDGMSWIGLIVALTPLWALIIYGVLRLTGRVSKPKGLPAGRRGGMGAIDAATGVPLSDAPYYAHDLNRKKAEEEAQKNSRAEAEED